MAVTGGFDLSLPFFRHALVVKENAKIATLDFSGGRVDKNPPANVRAHEFDPLSGKTPRAAEQQSP